MLNQITLLVLLATRIHFWQVHNTFYILLYFAYHSHHVIENADCFNVFKNAQHDYHLSKEQWNFVDKVLLI